MEHPYTKWKRIAETVTMSALPWLKNMRGGHPLTAREMCLVARDLAVQEQDFDRAMQFRNDLTAIDEHLAKANNGV